jgi:hypothetical protein
MILRSSSEESRYLLLCVPAAAELPVAANKRRRVRPRRSDIAVELPQLILCLFEYALLIFTEVEDNENVMASPLVGRNAGKDRGN